MGSVADTKPCICGSRMFALTWYATWVAPGVGNYAMCPMQDEWFCRNCGNREVLAVRDIEPGRSAHYGPSSPLRVRKGRKPVSAKQRMEVFKRCGFACSYCGRRPPDIELHVDHVVPVASGGTNDSSNLTAACPSCNAGKGTGAVRG